MTTEQDRADAHTEAERQERELTAEDMHAANEWYYRWRASQGMDDLDREIADEQ